MKYLRVALASVVAAIIAVSFLPASSLQHFKTTIGGLIAAALDFVISRYQSM